MHGFDGSADPDAYADGYAPTISGQASIARS
jgi:hypothetical protein